MSLFGKTSSDDDAKWQEHCRQWHEGFDYGHQPVNDSGEAADCPPGICTPDRSNTITGWIPSRYPNGHPVTQAETHGQRVTGRDLAEVRGRVRER